MNDIQNDPLDNIKFEESAENAASSESDAIEATEDAAPLEPDTTAESGDAAPLEAEIEEPKPESKTRVFFRKLFRSTLGFLIIFGIGFAVAAYTIYKPAVALQNSTMGELEDAQAQIADLDAQISTLQSAALESDAKLAEQSNFELHVAVLNARVDVANASLKIVEDNAAGALLALEKTDETLALIKSLLPAAQSDVIAAMDQRLALILTEIADNPFAAGSDLNVLATSLLQLEDATFGLR